VRRIGNQVFFDPAEAYGQKAAEIGDLLSNLGLGTWEYNESGAARFKFSDPQMI
jgi:hypothetical protein